jgi:hypothetical protein
LHGSIFILKINLFDKIPPLKNIFRFLGDISTEGGVDKTEILTYSHEGSLTIRRW